MAERIVTTDTTAVTTRASFWNAANIVYLIAGLLEALLAFRLVFRALGANPDSLFVSLIYSITHAFIVPFVGIFGGATADGAATTAVFEPATIIAMLVYALVAWFIVRLLAATIGRARPVETVQRADVVEERPVGERRL